MPKTAQTICVTLEPSYVEILQKIQKKQKKNSRSDVFRLLLNWYQKMEAQAELEKAYEEYYSNPKNVLRESQLTREMLQLASAGKRGAR